MGSLGKPTPSKTDEISEKFQRGGGVIFNPKIYIAKFGPLSRAICLKNLQYNFPKMRGGGGQCSLVNDTNAGE